MAYGVPFSDYQPGARNDGTPWSKVRVEESALATGPWVEIDVIDLDPVDTDPAHPQARSFTATHATLLIGWYRATFLDGIGGEQPAGIVDGGVANLVPSVQQVARFLRARTTGDGGELGVFTTATNPSVDQVEQYIETATRDVIAEVGRRVPPGALDLFRAVVIVGTAVLIEINSEMINDRRLTALTAMYDQRLARLLEAVQDVEQGVDSGTTDGALPLGLAPCNSRWDWYP